MPRGPDCEKSQSQQIPCAGQIIPVEPGQKPAVTPKPCIAEILQRRVCVAGQAICADCGDGACFRPDENCELPCRLRPVSTLKPTVVTDLTMMLMGKIARSDCVGVPLSSDKLRHSGGHACLWRPTNWAVQQRRRISGLEMASLGYYYSKVFSFTAPHTAL